jgi:hypothetical protein
LTVQDELDQMILDGWLSAEDPDRPRSAVLTEESSSSSGDMSTRFPSIERPQ